MIIEAVQKLAENKIGALLVFKGREPLERHIRGGVSLNGRISYPLLYGLFNTQSPTHDGAVIIEGEWIDRFAVYLPLSQHVKEGSEAGTRHAAGVGLSEMCDALVIVVSEERGAISVAEHGRLDAPLSPTALKERLDKFYAYVKPKNAAKARFTWLRSNIGHEGAVAFAGVLAVDVFRVSGGNRAPHVYGARGMEKPSAEFHDRQPQTHGGARVAVGHGTRFFRRDERHGDFA